MQKKKLDVSEMTYDGVVIDAYTVNLPRKYFTIWTTNSESI